MRAVLVTGVSRGLGRALFDELLALGGAVFPVAIGRRFEASQEASAREGRSLLFRADLADPMAVASLELEPVFDKAPRALTLIHNAGIVEPVGPIGAIEPSELVAAVAVNFTSLMVLTDRVLRLARARGVATQILNISSGAATRPIASWSAYCSTKAAARMYFDCLRVEDPSVSVTDVNPGVLDTDMQAAIRATPVERFPQREDFVKLERDGRLRAPRDAAREILKNAGLL